VALKTLEREIDGNLYYVTQLGFSQGREVMVRLSKLLGPAFGRLNGEGGAVAAMGELAAAVTEADLVHLCRVFGTSTEVQIEGKRPRLTEQIQELHFAGRYDTMLKWLWFAIEVNYGGFFDSVRRIGAAASPARDPASPSAVTSIGRSGASSAIPALESA
jgi:hypothetical protein